MAIRLNQFDPKKAGVKLASSLLVLSSVVASHHALAQNNEGVVEEELVVTGIRGSLKDAQTLKREASTFVDAISAKDINSLPDRSVTEALQRVPGVAISRFASPEDPDHFGTEGTGVIIRGLTQTRSEFNGRDTFSANSSRGLSFEDVSPELMGSVEVNKNQTADMIEGGIAGTINLNTRKPFDNDDRVMSFSIDGQYGDLAEEITPSLSGLFSNRWETDAGEFGFLISAAWSQLEKESHGVQSHTYEFRPVEEGNAPLGFGSSYNRSYVYDGTFVDAAPGTEIGTRGVIVPNGANAIMKRDERERKGLAAAFQWTNPDDTLTATVELLHSEATLAWNENTIKYDGPTSRANEGRTFGQVGGEDENGNPLAVLDYQFNEEGVFTSGSLADMQVGWRSNAGTDRVPNNASWDAAGAVPLFGHKYANDARYRDETRKTTDVAAKLEWRPTDSWEFVADYQHVEAETDIDDMSFFLNTYAIADFDLSGSGTPSINYRNPWDFAPNSVRSGAVYNNSELPYFENPSSHIAHAVMDHVERGEGSSDALRLDGTYNFDLDSGLKAVKFGVRWSERDQNIKSSAYNWAALDPAFSDAPGFLDQDKFTDSPLNLEEHFTLVDWGEFGRSSGDVSIAGNNMMLHPSDSLVENWSNWGTLLAPYYTDNCGDWKPLSQRGNGSTNADGSCHVYDDFIDTYFRPSEVFDTTETSEAAYVRLDFDREMDGQRLAGNIGFRYAAIETATRGFTQYPDFTPTHAVPAGVDLDNIDLSTLPLFDRPAGAVDGPIDVDGDGTASDVRYLGDDNNFLPADFRSFGDNTFVENTATHTTYHFLPSLNLKYEFTDEVLMRLGISKAIAKPDMGDRRNYVSISTDPNPVDFDRLPPTFGPQVNADGSPILDVNGDIVINPYPGIGSNGVVDTVLADGSPGSDGIPDRDVDGVQTNYDQQMMVDTSTMSFRGFTATAGNPSLEPMEAVQYDVSFEYYFADVGSLTTTFFYKDLEKFFITGGFDRNFTNPTTGTTQLVRVNGPINGGEASVSGFELAYQQVYDFLPEPFDGLGTSFNYTYVDASGEIPNNNTRADSADLGLNDVFAFEGELPLEQQSKDTVNIQVFYEKSKYSARLAYNWRSEYLVTTRDVISTLPIFNDQYYTLDANLGYNITDDIKISLEGKNLLDAETRTFMKVDGAKLPGRGWFISDRSYILRLTASF